MSQPDSDPVEAQREQVRALWRRRRFDEAADLAATLPDAVLLFTPTEDLADHIRRRRPDEAARLYEIAARFWRFEGTQATGSGEGILAMDNLKRVEDKRKKLLAESGKR